MTPSSPRLETVGPIRLAVVQRQAQLADLSRVVPACCGLVWNALRAHEVKAERNVALYWDDSIRLEVGVELHGPFAGSGEVVPSATPGGDVAAMTWFGPYHDLGRAHEMLREWCRGHGHPLAGPNWEIYDHWQRDWTADPSRIRTDIYYLLRAG